MSSTIDETFVGREIEFEYPEKNVRGLTKKWSKRRVMVHAVRFIDAEPLDPITLEFRPQVCRSQVLVTGIDLEKRDLRHYYNGSMRRVRKVTGPQTPPGPKGSGEKTPPASGAAGAFRGGEVTLARGHVEICGQIVLRDTKARLMRRILEELKARQSNEQFVVYDGSELAKRVKCEGGQNGVAGCIRDFRRVAAKILSDELGLVVGPQDIIRSGGPGYRFNEWMTIRESSNAEDSSAA